MAKNHGKQLPGFNKHKNMRQVNFSKDESLTQHAYTKL